MQPNNQQNSDQYPQTPVVQPVVSTVPQFSPQPQPHPTSVYVASYSNNEQKLRMNARRRLAMVIVAGVLVLAGIGGGIWFLISRHQNVGINNKVASMTMNADGLVPATVTIEKGQEVTITNADTAAHRLTADQSQLPNFDSVDMLNQGDSYTYTFEQSGTYHYYDPSNPTVFIGTVTVK